MSDPSLVDHLPLIFGQYKGYTPDQISEFDPGYLCWAYETVVNRGPICSELLYNATLPDRRNKKKAPPELAGVTVERGPQYVRKIYQPGSLAESRSHFEKYDDKDDSPF